MRFTDETLMAYADDELDEATRAEVAAAAAADPELARAIDRHRELGRRLRREFDRVLEEPVPQRLLDAVAAGTTAREAAKIAPLMRTRVAASAAPVRARWSWPEWGAMAAMLLVGAFVGTVLRPSIAPLIEAQAGHLVASGQLERTLTRQLARDVPAGARIRLGLSFRAATGEYCRVFALGDSSGLACRHESQWRIEVLAEQVQPETGAYRLAGVELPRALMEAVDARIEGDPLDVQAEATIRERGWRD